MPTYIGSDSLKYYPKHIKSEQRGFEEIWDTELNIKRKIAKCKLQNANLQSPTVKKP